MVRFLPLPAVVRLWVKLPVPSALPSEGQFHFALMPGGKRPDLSLRVYCPHRGVWSVRVDKVRVHDIFGLFSFPLLGKQALNNRELALTVYPQLYELTGEPLSPAILAEDSTAKAVVTDHGDSFSGTRQYRDGDSLKRIHWKQSIRTQELYTRQYEMSTEQYNLLVMDTGAPGRRGYSGICRHGRRMRGNAGAVLPVGGPAGGNLGGRPRFRSADRPLAG